MTSRFALLCSIVSLWTLATVAAEGFAQAEPPAARANISQVVGSQTLIVGRANLKELAPAVLADAFREVMPKELQPDLEPMIKQPLAWHEAFLKAGGGSSVPVFPTAGGLFTMGATNASPHPPISGRIAKGRTTLCLPLNRNPPSTTSSSGSGRSPCGFTRSFGSWRCCWA